MSTATEPKSNPLSSQDVNHAGEVVVVAAAAADAVATPPPPPTPSLYARKLLQKLSTLHPGASLESRQAIASWIIFNRKKCDGMGEGLLLSIQECSLIRNNDQKDNNDCDLNKNMNNNNNNSYDAESSTARLMVLLGILHQVLLSNSPTTVASTTTTTTNSTGETNDDIVDTWNKSSQLRVRLGEIVILPLWKALAKSFHHLNETGNRDSYLDEVGKILDEWKEHNVFGGPTIWEEYKRAWSRALLLVQEEQWHEKVVESSIQTSLITENVQLPPPELTDTSNVKNDAVGTEQNLNEETERIIKEEYLNDKDNNSDTVEHTTPKTKEETDAGMVTKRESIANIDIAIDFEGIEEAKVEPSKFLDLCKVISSIQITRDLGSDAAMNLSSALSRIPSEVEEACNRIHNKQQPISTETLSKIPDEVLDLDTNYVRQSLQAYKEAIRQQRVARAQLLQLLLQSRCSFGSIDAARTFYGGENSEVSMDEVLEKLKTRKEALVDAMALEGLDVEEDEEEKKLAREEVDLLPISWYTVQSTGEDKDTGDDMQPADKRLKTTC